MVLLYIRHRTNRDHQKLFGRKQKIDFLIIGVASKARKEFAISHLQLIRSDTL